MRKALDFVSCLLSPQGPCKCSSTWCTLTNVLTKAGCGVPLTSWVLTITYGLARVLRESRIHAYRGEIYCKGLACVIVAVWAWWQAGDPGNGCSRSPKVTCQKNCFFCKGKSVFLSQPLSDWMRPTRIMENNLFYLKSTYLKVNVSKKYRHRNI